MWTRKSAKLALSLVIAELIILPGCMKPGAAPADRSVADSADANGGIPQASLTVACGSMNICNATNTDWSLLKTGSNSANHVTWSVATTKNGESHDIITVDGFYNVTNTGSGSASIGSIVANLQRKQGKNLVTVASDIANATAGDAATTAKICSSASSEDRSSFSTNAGSVSLDFRDQDTNTVFSLVPQKSLDLGQSYNLEYIAKFDATVLGIPAGEQVRIEIIVTFGNAGARGGSGAVCNNVDANGNGVIEQTEGNVRSVPCRPTITIPAIEHSNSSVAVSDDTTAVSALGTVTFSNFASDIGGGAGSEITLASILRSVSLDADPGTDGGSITNCASLNANPAPSCNPPISLRSCDTQVIAAPVHVGFAAGDFCTYTQGGWGSKPNGNNPGTILAGHFAAAYPSGVEIGIPGKTGFSEKFTAAANISKYLPAGGQPKALTADLLNPKSSAAGVFGGQVLALEFNVDYSAGGFTSGTGGALGALTLHDTGTPLDGSTIVVALGTANTALGGGTLPAGMTYSSLSDLVTKLNEAFDGCAPSDWAQSHLSR